MHEKISPTLYGISETLLIPLYIRSQETRRADAMIRDEFAVKMVSSIDFDFSRIKLQEHDILGIVLRVREFDRFAMDFMAAHPNGVVVHIGCGFDTRFERVDNERVEWYDLDLPDVINLRRKLIHHESEHYHMLDCSVLDPAWIEAVDHHRPRPFLFIAEGVFPYFEVSQVKWFIQILHTTFPGAELVFDAHTPWVMHADNLQLALSKVKVRMKFALKRGQDIETWGDGIRMLEEWFYFGTDEPRVRPYRWMNRLAFLRKSTGIFHYQLGK